MPDKPDDVEVPEAFAADLNPAPRATTPPEPEPVEVTDAMRDAGHLVGDDWNPEDTVWEHEGVRVKVKCLYDEESAVGWDMYRLTGSIVGEDGKALRSPQGAPLVYAVPHVVTWHPYGDGADDLDAALDAERRKVVKLTARAHTSAMGAANRRGVGRSFGAARMLPVAPEALPEPVPPAPVREPPSDE